MNEKITVELSKLEAMDLVEAIDNSVIQTCISATGTLIPVDLALNRRLQNLSIKIKLQLSQMKDPPFPYGKSGAQ